MSNGYEPGCRAGVPEWSKGAHSRCAAKCFVGSNPTSGTNFVQIKEVGFELGKNCTANCSTAVLAVVQNLPEAPILFITKR
jgi:hypothetical protein